MLNLSLFNFNSDYFYLKVMIVIFLVIKLVSKRQVSGLKFHFNRRDKLMVEFLAKSKIGQLVYHPYWLAITPLLQSFLVCVHRIQLFLSVCMSCILFLKVGIFQY